MAERSYLERIEDLTRFYTLLDQLEQSSGGKRWLSELSQYRDWPQRGVYFFFDEIESRSDSGSGPRLVRVGTHAITEGSKATLRQRLGQHRGNLSGGGNHRGSIFRLLVGQSLLARCDYSPCPSWGVKGDKRKACQATGFDRSQLDALETPIERSVSEYLASLPFLWLKIDDEPARTSLRAYIERHSIALLSNYQRPVVDAPSKQWLGLHSSRERVRESGLWNQQHVESSYDPSFLDVLASLVANPGVRNGIL